MRGEGEKRKIPAGKGSSEGSLSTNEKTSVARSCVFFTLEWSMGGVCERRCVDGKGKSLHARENEKSQILKSREFELNDRRYSVKCPPKPFKQIDRPGPRQRKTGA